VLRRDFGSDLPDLVDQKMTPRNILAVYAAAAAAIEKWEPRFRMKRGQVLNATASGQLHLVVTGVYFPHGHLGDYSVSEDRTTRVVFTQ
jgi:phage baseplate assembly protein W